MNGRRGTLRYHGLWTIFGWGLIGLLFVLSLIPSPPEVVEFHWSDKVKHALAYALLMGWFMQIHGEGRTRARIALGLVTLGAGVELLQGLTGTRVAEWADAAANATGVLLAWTALRPPWTELLWRLEQRLVPR